MSNESISNKLSELFELFKSGALSKEEYELLKSQIIGTGSEKIQKVKIDSQTIEEVKDNQQETESPSSEKSNIFMNVVLTSRKLLWLRLRNTSNRIACVVKIILFAQAMPEKPNHRDSSWERAK